ncbi:MAG: ABC transporter substrate-binding protein [bacterium]|nr:ABC transporter substrate-binding protein [bacterium]
MIDPFTLEYRLRRGVKFHDGREFGAEDVKATIEWATRKESIRKDGPGEADVEIVDRYTARIKAKKYGYPASAWRFVVTLFPMLSAEDVADSIRLSSRLNGTGPFVFSEHSNQTTRFVANPECFTGKPKLDEIVYRVLPDTTSREVALRTGEADLIDALEPQQVRNFKGDPRFRLAKTVTAENKYLFFRCNKPPFDDWRVRRAACHAIDRKPSWKSSV